MKLDSDGYCGGSWANRTTTVSGNEHQSAAHGTLLHQWQRAEVSIQADGREPERAKEEFEMSLLRLQRCSSKEKQEKLELQVGEQGRLSLLCTACPGTALPWAVFKQLSYPVWIPASILVQQCCLHRQPSLLSSPFLPNSAFFEVTGFILFELDISPCHFSSKDMPDPIVGGL